MPGSTVQWYTCDLQDAINYFNELSDNIKSEEDRDSYNYKLYGFFRQKDMKEKILDFEDDKYEVIVKRTKERKSYILYLEARSEYYELPFIITNEQLASLKKLMLYFLDPKIQKVIEEKNKISRKKDNRYTKVLLSGLLGFSIFYSFKTHFGIINYIIIIFLIFILWKLWREKLD